MATDKDVNFLAGFFTSRGHTVAKLKFADCEDLFVFFPDNEEHIPPILRGSAKQYKDRYKDKLVKVTLDGPDIMGNHISPHISGKAMRIRDMIPKRKPDATISKNPDANTEGDSGQSDKTG